MESRCVELELQVQELNIVKEEVGKKVEEMLEDNRKYLSLEEIVEDLKFKINEKDVEILELKE